MPDQTQTATIRISNLDTVAFDYYVSIVRLTDGNGNAIAAGGSNYALSQQMRIEIKKEGMQTTSFMLADYDEPDNEMYLGYVLSGAEAQTFTITATFVSVDDDGQTNNFAQSAHIKFDILIRAIQKTTV